MWLDQQPYSHFWLIQNTVFVYLSLLGFSERAVWPSLKVFQLSVVLFFRTIKRDDSMGRGWGLALIRSRMLVRTTLASSRLSRQQTDNVVLKHLSYFWLFVSVKVPGVRMGFVNILLYTFESFCFCYWMWICCQLSNLHMLILTVSQVSEHVALIYKCILQVAQEITIHLRFLTFQASQASSFMGWYTSLTTCSLTENTRLYSLCMEAHRFVDTFILMWVYDVI